MIRPHHHQDEQQEKDDTNNQTKEQTFHSQEREFPSQLQDTTESSPSFLPRHRAYSTSSTTIYSSSSADEEGHQDDIDDEGFSSINDPVHSLLNLSHGGTDRLASFPLRLHHMLERAEVEGFQSTVSWLEMTVENRPSDLMTGKSDSKKATNDECRNYNYTPFKVHNPEKFVNDVIPRFFQMTKFKSFLRQLNIWGFSRDRAKGPLNGSYYHSDFVRHDPELCQKMKRTKNKGMYKRGTKGTMSSLVGLSSRKKKEGGLQAPFSGMASATVKSNGDESNAESISMSPTSNSANRMNGTHGDAPCGRLGDTLATNDRFMHLYWPIMRVVEEKQGQHGAPESQACMQQSRLLDSLYHQNVQRQGIFATLPTPFLSKVQEGHASHNNTTCELRRTDHSQDSQTNFSKALVMPLNGMDAAFGYTGINTKANEDTTTINDYPHWHSDQNGRSRFFSGSSLSVSRQLDEGSFMANVTSVAASSNVTSSLWSSTSVPPNVLPLLDTTSSPKRDTTKEIDPKWTNPQLMPREDLKYIMVGFKLGAANEEERSCNLPSSPKGIKGDDEQDLSHPFDDT